MKKIVLLLLTLTLLFSVAACGKKQEQILDENAVLTDSSVPLELGAELLDEQQAQTQATP